VEAPFTLREAVAPGHTMLGLAVATKDKDDPIITLSVCVSTHPLLLPLTVYTVLMLGLTTIKELVDPVLQL
jgi:hypothetical protein